jgi:ribonucleoside-diphosphate reductase alpha chain
MSASKQKVAQMMNTAVALASKPLGINAQRVVAKRYSLKDLKGAPLEHWSDIVKRVVSHVAQAETDPRRREEFTARMLYLMEARAFVPNTPCLVNAGKPQGQLAACFVLPVPDSLADIMEHAKQCALIHQSGGGTGMSYELLRPAGTPVGEGRGIASGPVSFMQIVNTMTETVKQGGVRRGANMGIIAVAHPDILRFIHAKNDQKSLTNFNISVTVTDRFLNAVENEEWFQTEFDGQPWTRPVFDPKAGSEGGDYTYNGQQPPAPGMVYAPDIWNRIISSTHRWAEPGIIFIDNVNRKNPLLNSMGPKKASNPCAEQMLHDFNACNLGSIDVAKYYDEDTDDLDWDRFADDIYWSVRFLDNVIDTCAWPLPQIDETVHRTRPVGLGVMGFADLLLHKRLTYGSPESAAFADRMMEFFQQESWKASLALGAEKGAMPELEPNRDLYEADLRRGRA